MTPTEQNFINAIAVQRNQALDLVANLQAELAARDQKIAELEAKLNPAE